MLRVYGFLMLSSTWEIGYRAMHSIVRRSIMRMWFGRSDERVGGRVMDPYCEWGVEGY